MPKLELDRTEIWDQRPGEPRVLRKRQPAISVKSGDGAQLFIQHGCVWGADGKMYRAHEVPKWFDEEVKKITKELLESCGFDYDMWKSRRAGRKSEATSTTELENDGDTLAASS